MAWVGTEIAVSGETVQGSINASGDVTRIEIPFIEGVSIGDSVSANGSDYEITGIADVGNRNETLMLEVQNGKSVSRRAASKSRG